MNDEMDAFKQELMDEEDALIEEMKVEFQTRLQERIQKKIQAREAKMPEVRRLKKTTRPADHPSRLRSRNDFLHQGLVPGG